MKKFLQICIIAGCLVGTGRFVYAQKTVHGGTAGFERIQKGAVEIGVENMILIHYNSTPHVAVPDATKKTLYATYTGGLAFRYFIMNNLTLGASVNVLFTKSGQSLVVGDHTDTEESRDIGVIAFLTTNYYVRLGNSLFFKPGIGVGGFYAGRLTPDPEEPGQGFNSTVSGGAGKLDLGFVFYASRNFNLKAGVDIVFKGGTESAPGYDSVSFFTTNAAVNVGLGYAF